MNQSQPPAPAVSKIVLWSIAAEPLFLAGLALLLDRLGALPRSDIPPQGDAMLIAFSALSLGSLWASFRFASGGFAPKPPAYAPNRPNPAFGHQIVAVALAAAPGVFGFAYYLIFGQEWALLAFCLGAFAAAARHALRFGALAG